MEAYIHFKSEKYDIGFLQYSLLAEMGYEVAQSNSAFLLDKGQY